MLPEVRQHVARRPTPTQGDLLSLVIAVALQALAEVNFDPGPKNGGAYYEIAEDLVHI